MDSSQLDRAFKVTVVNWTCPSVNGVSLDITFVGHESKYCIQFCVSLEKV